MKQKVQKVMDFIRKVNEDEIEYRQGKMPQNLWQPKIIISPQKNGLLVKFSPDFPNASYHKICIMDYTKFCVGGQPNITKGVSGKLIKEVEENETYRAMIRPFDISENPLDQWVAGPEFTYLRPSVSTTSTIPSTTTVADAISETSNNTYIIIIIIIGIILGILLVVLVIICRKLQPSVSNFGLVQKLCPFCVRKQDMVFTSDIVTILPLHLSQPETDVSMATEHINILSNQNNIRIVEPLHFINETSNHIDSDQLKLFMKGENNYIFIYVSKELLNILHNCSEVTANDQICLNLIKTVASVSRNSNKNLFLLSFGDIEPDKVCSPLKELGTIQSMVNLAEEGQSINVSFRGTEALLNKICPGQFISLNAEETKRLHILVVTRETGSSEMDPLFTSESGYDEAFSDIHIPPETASNFASDCGTQLQQIDLINQRSAQNSQSYNITHIP